MRWTPWWVAPVVWWVTMALTGAIAVQWLGWGLRLAATAALDADLTAALGAAYVGYVGVLLASWWIKEARHWRELTPRSLRPGRD